MQTIPQPSPFKKCPKCDTPAEVAAILCRTCGHAYRQSFTPPSLNQTQYVGQAAPPLKQDSAPIVFLESPKPENSGARILGLVLLGVCGLILCIAALIFAIGSVINRNAPAPEVRNLTPGSAYPFPAVPSPPPAVAPAAEERYTTNEKPLRTATSDIQFGNKPPETNPTLTPRRQMLALPAPYRVMRTGSPGDNPAPLPRPLVINHGPEPGRGAWGGYGKPDGLISSEGAPVGHQPRRANNAGAFPGGARAY